MNFTEGLYKYSNGVKLALAIRQLENSEVLHDGYDVHEDGVENVLKEYGIFNTWTEDEEEILKKHLIDMAFREEVREAERWAQSDPVLAFIKAPIKLNQSAKKKSRKTVNNTDLNL